MKTSSALCLAAVLFAAGCQSPPAPSVNKGAITVNFTAPDNFTDARETAGGSTSQFYLDELAKTVKERAAARLAAGQKLEVTFTDIDLAGDIPPQQTGNIRVIKDIYIPRMSLHFRLTAADGAVLKEGDRKLSDLDFQTRIMPITERDQPLSYDKQMLADWVNKEFHP